MCFVLFFATRGLKHDTDIIVSSLNFYHVNVKSKNKFKLVGLCQKFLAKCADNYGLLFASASRDGKRHTVIR